jgi:hypothetical protein
MGHMNGCMHGRIVRGNRIILLARTYLPSQGAIRCSISLNHPICTPRQQAQLNYVVAPLAEVLGGHRRGAKHGEVSASREQPRVLLRQIWWYQWQLERLS